MREGGGEGCWLLPRGGGVAEGLEREGWWWWGLVYMKRVGHGWMWEFMRYRCTPEDLDLDFGLVIVPHV